MRVLATALGAVAVLLAAPSSALELPKSVTGVADGRTVIAVPLSSEGGESAWYAPEAAVRCEQAPTFPAVGGKPPAILPPALEAGGSLACRGWLGADEATFEVSLSPPGPGLHASLVGTRTPAEDTPLVIRVFRMGEDGTARPVADARHATSFGSLLPGETQWAADLPPSKVPRTLVAVIADDEGPGALFVPLAAATKLPVTTTTGSKVEVYLQGQLFGPVVARARKVKVPVEVAPGPATAHLRAIGKYGNESKSELPVEPPDRPRLAALSPGERVGVGSTVAVHVALADAWGRPGGSELKPLAEAEGGAVTATEQVGPGLWTLSWRVPSKATTAALTVRHPDGKAAGETRLEVEVVPSSPSEIVAEVPPGPFAPASDVALAVEVRDEFGNQVSAGALSATADHGAAEVDAASGRVMVRLPEQLPTGGLVAIFLAAGDATSEALLPMMPGPPARATIDVQTRERAAEVRVATVDRFGNAASSESLELETDGGKLERLPAGDDGAVRARIVALPQAHTGAVRVRGADGALLAESPLAFGAPPSRTRLGVQAVAGLRLADAGPSPWLGLGLAVASQLGRLELGAALRGEPGAWSASGTERIGGVDQEVDWRLTSVMVPVLATLRYSLGLHYGIGLAAGPTFAYASGRGEVGALGLEQTSSRWVAGLRAELRGDRTLGPGRLFLVAGFGRLSVGEGPVVGGLDGFDVGLGYEWRFAALGGG